MNKRGINFEGLCVGVLKDLSNLMVAGIREGCDIYSTEINLFMCQIYIYSIHNNNAQGSMRILEI